MTWEKIETNAHDFSNEPELVGKLKEKVPSQFEGNDYLVTADNGKDVLVFGKTVLKTKLERLEIGTKVKIVYLGMKISPKSNKKYADFEVYVDSGKINEEAVK